MSPDGVLSGKEEIPMFSKGESGELSVVTVVVGLARAQMTGCRDLTTVGEMGSDGGQYGPCGPCRCLLCHDSLWHFLII